MRYDPKVRGLMSDTYPEFAKTKIFYASRDYQKEVLDDLIRVGIVYIDRDAPGKNRVLTERLNVAIEYVNPVPDAKDLILKHDPLFLDTLYHLFWLYHDTEMELWLTHKMNYHNLTKEMRGGYLKTTDNLRLNKDIDAYLDNLLKIESRIFDDQFLKQLVNQREAEKQLSGFAEKFALKFEIRKK